MIPFILAAEDEIMEKVNNAYDMAASYERDDSQDR